MRDHYVLGGLVLAAIVIIVYIIVRVRASGSPELTDAVRLFFGCIGLATGLKIIVMGVQDGRLDQLTDNERLYIVLGGAAASWVCLQTLIKPFSSVADRSERSTDTHRRAITLRE